MLLNPISMIDTTFYHILSIYVLNGKTISTEKATNWFNYEGIDNELKTLHFIVKHNWKITSVLFLLDPKWSK